MNLAPAMIADKASDIAISAVMKSKTVIYSDAHEGLHQPADEAGELQLALHGDQTNAFLAAVDHRRVAVVMVGVVAIAGGIAAAFVNEGTGQNAGQLGAGVAVLGDFQARRRLEHEHARTAFGPDLDHAMAQAGRDPAPGAELITEQCFLFR